jgi:hypothetical protein
MTIDFRSAKFITAATAAFATAAAATAAMLPTAASVAAPESRAPFSVLDRSAAALPSGPEGKALESLAANAGFDVASLRAATPGVWVAKKASGDVCIFATNTDGLGGGCFDAATAASGGAVLETRSTRGDGKVSRLGLAPDGFAKAAALDGAGREVASVAISNNIYRLSGTGLGDGRLSKAAGGTPLTLSAK